MAEYRLYLLDGAGQFASAEWIVAESDGEAVSIARSLRKSVKAEVWQGARLVAEVAPAVGGDPVSDGSVPDTDRKGQIPPPPEAPRSPGL